MYLSLLNEINDSEKVIFKPAVLGPTNYVFAYGI